MKFAISSDWHLHNYSGAQVRTLPDGTNSRLRDILNCCDWMVQQAVDRGCGAFLHGGDVTHNRKLLHISAWNRTTDAFRRWGERIPFHVNEGNHDQDMSGDGTSTVGALRGIVADAVTEARVTTVGRTRIGWLPYLDDASAVREATAKLAKQGARVLIAHLGIGDPKHADCLPIDYETPGHINVSDLNPELFQQVFLGHYHTSQDLAPNVRYIGSPLQLSFKEAGIRKGFWTWDPETDEAEFVENGSSPLFHIMTETEAETQLCIGRSVDLRETDFVWVKGATQEGAASLRRITEGRTVPFRIEVAPQVTAAKARLSADAKTDQQLVGAYVGVMNPAMPDEQQVALAKVGAELLDATRGTNA